MPNQSWETRFDRAFTWKSKGETLTESGTKRLKLFISKLLEDARENAVREHDAKWHPMEKENEHWKLGTHEEVVNEIRQQERERIITIVESEYLKAENINFKGGIAHIGNLLKSNLQKNI